MKKDAIDEILEQWSAQRPELDTAGLGVVIRIMSLYKSCKLQATQALEPLGLELFEYDVLSALRRQGKPFALAATILAKETGLSAGAMTNRVDKLAMRGLVQRHREDRDRRAVLVSLTSKGRRVIDEAIRLRLHAADESLRNLSAKERHDLAKLLRKALVGGKRPD